MPDYNFYPASNTDVVKQLNLQKHPEGGYFVETDRQEAEVPSPFANNEPRSLATSIFYLLTYEERRGKLHMNKSVTYHVLHHGRAEYTLITPGTNGSPPKIEKKVMGTNVEAGEQRLLLVEGGIWKMSAIPETDIQSAKTAEQQDRTGCLITEVVTPGFHWEDHCFLTSEKLKELFKDSPDGPERIKEFSSSIST